MLSLYKTILHMTTIELKTNFHQLIDSIEDKNLLQQFFELMSRKRKLKDGELWKKQSQEEIEELLMANEECENPDNLISHEEVKKGYHSDSILR
jgi:hypothetical protein